MGTITPGVDDQQAAHALATDPPPPVRPHSKGFWRIYVERNKMGTFGIALLVGLSYLTARRRKVS